KPEDKKLRTIPLQRIHKVQRTRSLRQHRRTTIRIQSKHATLRLGLQKTRKREKNRHGRRRLPTRRIRTHRIGKPPVNPLQPTIKTVRSQNTRRTTRSNKTRRRLTPRLRLPSN